MRFDCLICGKKIWFFQEGIRLSQGQEKSITGEDRPTEMYMEGEFAHYKCFFHKKGAGKRGNKNNG